MKKYECPNCGKKELIIVNNTNFDNLVTTYYPKCNCCGFTTSGQFENKEALILILKGCIKKTNLEDI